MLVYHNKLTKLLISFCKMFFKLLIEGSPKCEQARRQAFESEGDKLSAGGLGGAVSPPTGLGAEPRKFCFLSIARLVQKRFLTTYFFENTGQ